MIKHIVLTGGPCAGKSTGISIIEQRLSNMGYRVITFSESATDVINSGVKPIDIGGEDFQKLLVEVQIARDKLYSSIIEKKYKKDKVIVIHDRGIMDGMAYCEEDKFIKVLNECNHSVQSVYNLYDGVFHLVSAAIGAEEFYTLSNNNARTETVEEAREADRRTLNAWIGHPHLRVINNETNFEGKMNRLMKEILGLLGEPEPLEIERKYLIERPKDSLLDKLGATKTNIVQIYLSNIDGTERRIRQRGINGSYSYYYTEKKEIEAGVRVENEKKIGEQEYIRLIAEADPERQPIVKTRYCFIYKDTYFELDEYKGIEDSAILEVEVDSLDREISIPDYIEVIKEVTGDKRYFNSTIAKYGIER